MPCGQHRECARERPGDPPYPAGRLAKLPRGRTARRTIRRAVHEALRQADKARNVAAQSCRREPYPAEQEALDFCDFQLGTIRDYMEPPGSPELEQAYKRYVSEPDASR